MSDLIKPLTTLRRHLVATYPAAAALLPSYPAIWRSAVEGRFPATQHRGRWFFAEADTGLIAEALGVTTSRAA